MKNDDYYLRIKQQRENKDIRVNIPYVSYHAKHNRSKRLLKNVQRLIKDKVSRKEALIQYIIADVTAFEIYFRDLFHATFIYCEDERKFLAKCEKLIDKKFDFSDLVIISHDKIELCDIIIEHQKFQNLTNLDKVFSTVIKDHFFESLNNREFEVRASKDDEKPIRIRLKPDWYKKLDEYLKLRHNLTHDYNSKLKINNDKIAELHENLFNIIAAVDTVFFEDIFIPYMERHRFEEIKLK